MVRVLSMVVSSLLGASVASAQWEPGPAPAASPGAPCAASEVLTPEDRLDTRVILRGVIDEPVRACLARVEGRVISSTRGVGTLVVAVPVYGLIALAEMDEVQSVRILGASTRARVRLAERVHALQVAAKAHGVTEGVAAAQRFSTLNALGTISAASYDVPAGTAAGPASAAGGPAAAPQSPSAPLVGTTPPISLTGGISR